ncbi:MAG: hypothetical protein A6F71_00325 [Cycloclasticus sp. symbiont of Poecilosclerida sp. M]|nr:MAG: hypothetical protein A6F71_00325 [Cycloclasticus sp. symbiont of Poecilosclerida sp. M]
MSSMIKNRLKLIFITVLFALPVMTAWYVYKNPELLEGAKTKNYGELISPAIPTTLGDYFIAGDADVSHLKGRWMAWHIDLDGRCDEACGQSVHMMRQLHVLLNKDSGRLHRIYLDKADAARGTTKPELAEDKELTIFVWQQMHADTLKGLVPNLLDGDILLFDPLGNLMMRYQQGADPYGIKKDLKLLFKASQIG